ncbi:MobC family plasmid mobilization relaxosome protein [Paenibacillus sp. KQZ6P-2]|uniref:MobC family plasmid mobilization relaxosome protein n=1 Tax=Paenibacillus mangrovi TaxID=2931978 RepID=A0A9X2B0R0_9BACL|nr:plasmid mobilization relaxosome protein MobC [Paenibacillus mangrovi]MCJ8010140.1 MobC family plasmid mobilization relaxosome protein [Paenibacillus mangrovi]
MSKKRYRNKEIKFFVTEEELEFIDNKAKAAELNRSLYIRKMAIEGYIIKQDFTYVEELVYEVNKIGNNINQIAFRANSMDYLSVEDLIYLRKKLDEIYSRIEQFYGSG